MSGSLTCRYCHESGFSAAGIQNHEQWCEDNPLQGVPPKVQDRLDLAEEDGSTPATGTNSHQGAETSGAGLPKRRTLGRDQKPRETGQQTEMPDDECPNCGSTDVEAAGDARDEYQSETSDPSDRALLAFSLAGRYCNKCFHLIGGEFSEPTHLENAVAGEEVADGA